MSAIVWTLEGSAFVFGPMIREVECDGTYFADDGVLASDVFELRDIVRDHPLHVYCYNSHADSSTYTKSGDYVAGTPNNVRTAGEDVISWYDVFAIGKTDPYVRGYLVTAWHRYSSFVSTEGRFVAMRYYAGSGGLRRNAAYQDYQNNSVTMINQSAPDWGITVNWSS